MSRLRHENKYLISAAQAEIIRACAQAVLKRDTHSGDGGIYHIRSLYFDTPYDYFCHENEAGVDNRRKYRIRTYGDSEHIRMEIKSKICGMTGKESCWITREQFGDIVHGKVILPDGDKTSAWNKFITARNDAPLIPAVTVDYDREAFTYPDGNVRVTFDSCIMSSNRFDAFFDETLPGRPILPTGQTMLEIKYDEFIPDFILNALSVKNLQMTAFSKYYLCRKFDYSGREINGY